MCRSTFRVGDGVKASACRQGRYGLQRIPDMKRWGSYNTLGFTTRFYPQVTLLVNIYTVILLRGYNSWCLQSFGFF